MLTFYEMMHGLIVKATLLPPFNIIVNSSVENNILTQLLYKIHILNLISLFSLAK